MRVCVIRMFADLRETQILWSCAVHKTRRTANRAQPQNRHVALIGKCAKRADVPDGQFARFAVLQISASHGSLLKSTIHSFFSPANWADPKILHIA